MLHLQAFELLLHLPQPLPLGHRCRIDRLRLTHQLTVANLLAPARQHERMYAQRLGNILDQHAGLIAHLHCLQLETDPVPIDLLRSWCAHRTPSSLGESVNKTDSRSSVRLSEWLGGATARCISIP